MELRDLIEIVGAIISYAIGCLFELAFVGVFIFVLFYPRVNRKKQLQIWQKLADQYGLTYRPGGSFDLPQVFGYYKGYPLRLETFSKNNRNKEICTRAVILLTAEPPAHQVRVTLEDILNVSLTEPEIIRLFQPAGLTFSSQETIKATPQGWQIIYEKEGLATDLSHLTSVFDWLIQIIEAYPAIIALGGEAVACLQKIFETHEVTRPLARQLLHDIGKETTHRLRAQGDHLFCPRCLTCCGEHQVDLNWWASASYYGCRTCGQSRQFLEGGVMVAILDNQTSTELSQQHGALYVNWSLRRELFDFSEVKIAQATDEEVERFAVQIGNDTDPVRQGRYAQMRCAIEPGCQLSPNTLKILQRIFSQVIVEEVVNDEAISASGNAS